MHSHDTPVQHASRGQPHAHACAPQLRAHMHVNHSCVRTCMCTTAGATTALPPTPTSQLQAATQRQRRGPCLLDCVLWTTGTVPATVDRELSWNVRSECEVKLISTTQAHSHTAVFNFFLCRHCRSTHHCATAFTITLPMGRPYHSPHGSTPCMPDLPLPIKHSQPQPAISSLPFPPHHSYTHACKISCATWCRVGAYQPVVRNPGVPRLSTACSMNPPESAMSRNVMRKAQSFIKLT